LTAVLTKDHPSFAMIVPTRGGSAGVDADRLLERWGGQSWLPDELIVVRGAQNPAAARNLGADSTPAELLIFADDDGWPCHRHTLEKIISALMSDNTVWLSAAAIQLPAYSSRLQMEYAREIPQNSVKIPSDSVDSVMAYSLCCAISRVHFTLVKGFDERITSGEDSDLRDRLRESGGRVVLAGGTGVYHPPPNNLSALWKRGFWYGRGEAQMTRMFRGEQWRQETKPKSLGYILLKALLSPACLLLNWESLRTGQIRPGFQPLRMLHIWAMTGGYITGRFTRDDPAENAGTPVIERHRFSPHP